MKKIYILLILILFVSWVNAEVRVNEIMPHTNNTFSNEWIEIYNHNSSNVSLINWVIADNLSSPSNSSFSINISPNDYALLVDNAITYGNHTGCEAIYNYTENSNFSCFELSWLGSKLNDGGDTLFLFDDNNTLIFNYTWASSIITSGQSYSYNGSAIQECNPTPGSLNNCTTTSSSDSSSSTSDPDPEIDIEWDEDDIINGQEFEITIDLTDLDDEKYDVRIWIENDDEEIISERYDEENEEWKSGKYYVEEFLEGDGDKDDEIKIRIDLDYEDFKGDATIYAKLRDEEGDVIDEVDYDIEIFEKEEDEPEKEDDEDEKEDEDNSDLVTLTEITDEDKKIENSILYKSKNEYIKEGAIYSFSMLCIVIIILLLIDKR